MKLPPPPWVVAHRGASGERLENTIEACHLAVELGAPAVEVDVQLAADGVPVVFHDWDLERLGSGDRRVVEQLESRELGDLELALGPTGRRGRAPTLAELLAALPAGFPINLELKRREADRVRFATAIASLVAVRPNVLVSSFDWEQLASLRALTPELPLAPLGSRDPAALLAAGERLEAWSLHAHRRLASAELVAAAAAAGRPLLVYTVNEVADARALFAFGVAGVFTDHPALLLRAAVESAC